MGPYRWHPAGCVGGILPPLVESETLWGQPRLGGAALRFQVQRLIDHSTASTAKGASCERSAPPHFRRSPAQNGAPLATQGSIILSKEFFSHTTIRAQGKALGPPSGPVPMSPERAS